ncbi:30S ribosomal protein S7 [Candidatus Azambacteria bacterium RIFCSPHIGHO2_01_FULL_44_55]|uniref:Small ribosomal subunit protein uS7 n=1 Tax=Candidatus Azambacteria bacterium RIFCSPLOWO2_02_FULL_44_14 TaxID=1797306 RepID=A0A1F5CBI9_9BACT|nr:MAG: 30S ribosomal protein S7 [Candidatus Azambacteria bacterium RIFCSPLOWO2_01_FULL_44_84]OGD32732.1 MAG: 30S ribosomal protein S7 [Candidatus Azambacteria bacterium RIFCSPHIGHO2_02_FULL_45_18]OGD40185.1 MAG: 30S ribosomal protein S7 [Candidatus Azambacteria bacterium RIFCSPLOWO2_02_FULL_44_14]OGD41717.1 MAG: 30S ribosomal protein S7 [Candidatus Azambacteria bacterium RIFCSPHIGHO2_01_FULL_44_55]
MRRKREVKRNILPDTRYNNVQVAKFINYLMRQGRKTAAQKILYGAFDIIEKEKKANPLEIFDRALRNVSPVIEVKSKRVGGANYQVPQEVRGERKTALTFRWIIGAANAKKGKPMRAKLAEELLLASNNEGNAIKKKLDMHRMAEANRAFAHFSW